MHSDTESYKCGRCSCSPLPLKEALKTIAPDGVERAETDGAVSVDIMEELEQPVLPEQRTLVLVQQGNGLLLEHPAQQIVDVLTMILEMLPADAAELGYVMDGYLVKGLLRHERFERTGQSVLSLVGNCVSAFIHGHPSMRRV